MAYTIRSGDTLWGIAQRNHVSLADLERANPQFTNPNLIHPGEQVTIPGRGYSAQDTRGPARPSNPYAGGAPSTGRVGGTPSSLAALNWAEGQKSNPNVVNPNNGQMGPGAWDDWCLGFVAKAFGGKVPEMSANSAIDAYGNFKREGKIRTDWKNMPAGSPVFWGTTAGNPYGHIAIFTGRFDAKGQPLVVSTGWKGHSGMGEYPVSYFSNPLGYAVV